MSRRPLASRSTAWAKALTRHMVAVGVTANQISILSLVFASLGCASIASGPGWVEAWAAAICVQLRLLCNLLDGMVAIEGGKGTPVGPLFNELPDRIADSLLLVPLGYVVGLPWLGWLMALLATSTAYVRVFGGAMGLAQDFSGVMAKQRRMAALTAGLLAQGPEAALLGSRHSLLIAAIVIAVGSLVTCWTRTAAIARQLRDRA